jgi:MoaA/NifB/PqqE/SkfB family radical SAM enzyme
MNKLNTYTSTGMKLLSHPSAITQFKMGYGTPISLQVGPTSRCNLKCSFCSNVNRKSHEDLDIRELAVLMYELRDLGLRTVEWTGGGDPTCYEYINEAIDIANHLHLEQGMITNGLLLHKNLHWRSLQSLKWLRVSMNCLDYVDDVVIPNIQGTLGFSYVWNDRTGGHVLARLNEQVWKHKPEYVRIVPNCQATQEEQEENNRVLSYKVANMGDPYFYQEKTFSRPKRCWWCYWKPFLLHDGYVYPCSSVVLNDDSDRSFHEKYRWVHMDDLVALYKKKAEAFDSQYCDHCVFRIQNDLCEAIIEPGEMCNFI